MTAAEWDGYIAALEAALGSPELECEYEGRRTRYRSVAELRQQIAYAREQRVAAGGSAPVTQSFATFCRD